MSATKVTSFLSQTLKNLVPAASLPPTLRPRACNLYEVLSRTPTGGLGLEVHQTRWSEKNIPESYWVITRSQFKNEGKNGKAWGRLYWKGVAVSPREERIRGSLKYSWKEGRSIAKLSRLQGNVKSRTLDANPSPN